MNRKTLVIVGCGGFCVEIVVYLQAIHDANGTERPALGYYDLNPENCRYEDACFLWGEKGFITDSLNELDPDKNKKDKKDKYEFLVSLGDPIQRRRLFRECIELGLTPFTLIHPSAQVCKSARIGAGSLICPFSYVGPFADVGTNAVLNTFASAGHDSTVGPSAVLSPYAALNGSARCGEAAFLGSSATISPSCSLGAFSKLSAGSVLNSDTKEGALATGVPAKHRVMFRLPED